MFATYFKENKRTLFILSMILLIGIFLRAYKFHDWMRFSMDQSRDATIISNALEHKAPLPLLGPDAGNTKFLLGPMYYDLSYISAKIFGNYPDRMAYPSLFSAILAIPFLFFFLREYFNQRISLMLTAIMSASYFMVTASRFSSNPNLVPLFVILYLWALLKLMNDSKKFNLGWSALVGFSLGMGIQMHATILVVMPIVGLLVLAYLWEKGARGIWKSLLIVIALTALLNTGQIISELNTHFQNSRFFFSGFQNKSQSDYGKSLTLISACQIEANSYIVSSVGDDYQCSDILKAPQGGKRIVYSYFLILAVSLLFSFCGYYFLIRNFNQEKETKRKNFLGLVLLFNLVTFIILMSVSGIIHVGYYIVLFFVPLVLLGIVMETTEKKYGQKGTLVTTAIIGILIVCSLIINGSKAVSYANGLENNSENSTLSQDEAMTKYILATRPKNTSQVYFAGQGALAKRYYDPIAYLSQQAGLQISLKRDIDPAKLTPGEPIYYISDNSYAPASGGLLDKHEIISSRKFFNQRIFILKN